MFDSTKKSKAQKHIPINAMLSSGFFPKNALGDGPAFSFFHPGFTNMGSRLAIYGQQASTQLVFSKSRIYSIGISFYGKSFRDKLAEFLLLRSQTEIIPPVIKVTTVADVILIEIMSKLQITLLSVNK